MAPVDSATGQALALRDEPFATEGAIGAFSIFTEPHLGHGTSPAATSRSNEELEENQPSNSWPFSHFTL